MNRNVILAVILIIACAAFGVKVAADAQRPRGTDVLQLQRMLMEGEAAVEARRAAGVNKFISNDYQDSLGMSDTSLKYQIRGYLQERQAVELTIPTEGIAINVHPSGKTGTVQFQVAVTSQSEGNRVVNQHNLSLRVAKEPVYYYWVFPGEEWRVTSAEGYVPTE